MTKTPQVKALSGMTPLGIVRDPRRAAERKARIENTPAFRRERFKQHQDEALETLALISNAVANYVDLDGPINWGHIGSMQEVNSKLHQLGRFLGVPRRPFKEERTNGNVHIS